MKVSRTRCVLVALIVTAAGSGIAVLLARGVVAPVQGVVEVEGALDRSCLVLLLGCTTWAWLAAMAGVRDAWLGAAPDSHRGGVVRRLALAACGVAVTGVLMAPATYADRLDGLPLPQRATDAVPPAERAPEQVRVRTGDTLWAIAADRLPPEADERSVTAGWQRLYRANRDLIGTDPDLIQPGQILHQPKEPS